MEGAVSQLRKTVRAVSYDGFAYYAYTKMLFSALVDADFLDTEAFMDKERSKARQMSADGMEVLWQRKIYKE